MKRLTISLLISALAGAGLNCQNDPADDNQDLGVMRDLRSPVTADLAVEPMVDMATPADLSLGIPRDFVVVRVGDGTATLNATAAPVFIERRQVSDGVLSVPPIALPTQTSGTQRRLTLAGNGITEGGLSRSVDGRYLTLVGYDAAVGTAAVATTTTPAIPARVIARIGADDLVDTTTTFAPAAANAARSTVSTDGMQLWTATGSGLLAGTHGGTQTQIATANIRMLGIADGQLYVSRAQNNATGINKIGTGLPTTATQTLTMLPGFPGATANGDPYAWAAFDLNPNVAGIDTIYVADNGTTPDRGIQRWRLNNGTWTNTGAFSMTTTAIGVIGFVDGSNVRLIALVRTPVTAIIAITDDGIKDPTTVTPTTLQTTATNITFRGLAFPPTL